MSKKSQWARAEGRAFETEAQAIEKGQQQFASGQYQEAIRTWTRWVELNPTSPIKSRLAEAHFRKVLELYRSNVPINSIISELNFCVRYDPDWAPYWHHLGLAYLKAGIFAKAASSFRKAASLDPGCERYLYHQALAALESNSQEAEAVIVERIGSSPRWDYIAALLELKEGRPQEAVRALHGLADENGEVLFIQGIAAHREGRPDLAAEFLQSARRKNAANPVITYCLGNVYSALNDFEKATQAWECAYEAGLRNPELVQNLATALSNRALDLIAQGQPDEAIARLLRVSSLVPARAAEIKPLLAGCYALKGHRAANEGNLAEANKAWAQAIELYNQRVAATGGGKSAEDDQVIDHLNALYHNQALVYDRLGEPEKAVLYWEKVIKNWRRASQGEKRGDELLVSAYHHLAEVYQKLGRLKDAIAAYEQVIRYRPDVWEVQQELGELYLAEEQWHKAANHWAQVIQLKEDDSDAHTKFGIALEMAGRHKEALEQWKRALALEPGNTFAKKEIFRSREGEIIDLLDSGRFDRALKILEELLDLLPDFPVVRIMMSDAYWGKGQREKAMQQIELAIATSPDTPGVWIEVVDSLLYNERTKEAHAIIQRAEGRFAENPLFYLSLGRIYLEYDRERKATQYFDKALTLAQQPDPTGRFPRYDVMAVNIASEWIDIEEFGKARKYLKTAIAANSEKAEPYYLLGCAYAEEGMMEEAEKAWAQAEELAERENNKDLIDDLRAARRYFGRRDDFGDLQELMKFMRLFR